MPKRDPETPGPLFDWDPPEIVHRFDERRVCGGTLRSRIARAVAETLRDCPIDRPTIASHMADWLGEDVSKNMLDAYAAEAREDHTIPFLRLLALVHVTGDARLLQLGAELFGHAVVEERYLPWVRVGQLADTKDDIDREFEYARRQARRGARR